MARKIFKAGEVKEINSRVLITPPQIRAREKMPDLEQEIEEIEEAEALEAEILEEEAAETEPAPSVEDEQQLILDDAERIRDEAQAEVERIKKEAEEAAFKLMQKSNVDVRKAQEAAEAEAERILAEARKEAQGLKEEARHEAEAILEEARKNAYGEGREEGYKEGQEEVGRLIERLHEILNAASDKRQQIIDYTERQMVDLVLVIARKVVKVISESEKRVVVENVKQALKKVKGETEITIKVNTKDLGLTTRHKKQFIDAVESLKKVHVEEDSRVGPGGCVIETSFGDIDARIQKQLDIIEERIRELTPIEG